VPAIITDFKTSDFLRDTIALTRESQHDQMVAVETIAAGQCGESITYRRDPSHRLKYVVCQHVHQQRLKMTLPDIPITCLKALAVTQGMGRTPKCLHTGLDHKAILAASPIQQRTAQHVPDRADNQKTPDQRKVAALLQQ
jgi:hypothetical protein